MPSEAFLKFPCCSLNEKYEPSLGLLLEALDVIKNSDILPVPKHDKHINVIDCENEYKLLPVHTLPFNVSDYCLVHNVALLMGNILEEIGDFSGSVNILEMILDLHRVLDLRFSINDSAPYYQCMALHKIICVLEQTCDMYKMLHYLKEIVQIPATYNKTARNCDAKSARKYYTVLSKQTFICTCRKAFNLFRLIYRTDNFYICSHCDIQFISPHFESFEKEVINFQNVVTITVFKNSNFKTFADVRNIGNIEFKCPFNYLNAYGGTWDKNGKYDIFLNTTLYW